MRTDLLRELERRVAVDPADFNAIQQLVNLSLRVGWTYKGKSLKVWINGIDRNIYYPSHDLRVLGQRLLPKFIELIESGRPDQLTFVSGQLGRMGNTAQVAIPALVNALSENFREDSDLRIMRCLGEIGCGNDLVDLGIALSCESKNSLLHFEALKTLIRIDPKRFIESYQGLVNAGTPTATSNLTKTLDEESFREWMKAYHSDRYWSQRLKGLQTIIRHGQDAHIERALEELRTFIESEPSRSIRDCMLMYLVPVADAVVDLLPELIRRHCEDWSREEVNLRRGIREHSRDKLLPLLLRTGPAAIDALLAYLDSLIESYQKALRGHQDTVDVHLATVESLRLLEAFNVQLVPAMIRTFQQGRRGLKLRRLGQMRAAVIAPKLVVDAIAMALVVLAFEGTQKTRANAIECLGIFRTQECLPGIALAFIIKDEPDGKARRSAIDVLRGMSRVARSAFTALLESVRSGTDSQRIGVAAILVELGWTNTALIETFSEILQSYDEKKSMKRHICQIVERIGPGAAALRPELEWLSKNFNVSLRQAAERALCALTA
ncbi:MAG: hypothetical protein P1V97_00850 [Planctomycetota bacterium]|nr:hypothetical protein [Planctomycetota bacterium]